MKPSHESFVIREVSLTWEVAGGSWVTQVVSEGKT